jgi:hypothetical protein
MPDDVIINVRERGARRTSREIDGVGKSVSGLGRHATRSSRGLRLFTRATVSAGHGLRMTAGAATYGAAAIGGGLLIELKRSTDAWQESRKVTAQTGAVIRSTGGVANVTAGEVAALSTSISRKAGVDDEAIQSGANLLLTFKQVRNEAGAGNDVFNRATKAAVDLSAAGFGSISSASKQLGKALNDPIKGLTALNRSGVTFTQRQRDRIKQYVEEGQTLKAQRIILREVESQVGGSAAAQATAIDRVKVSWQNVEEAIGKGTSPAVDALADRFDKFFVRAEPRISALGDRLGTLFHRKDLNLNEKFSLAGRDARRTFAPLTAEIRSEIGAMRLGDKLSQAFDRAAPMIGDAAARAAPKAAGAFVRAWWDMGLAGKLFSLAVLSNKLGVFTLLGRTAAARFGAGWTSSGGGLPGGAPGPGGPAGKLSKLGKIGRTVPWLATAIVTGETVGSALHGTAVGRGARKLIGNDAESIRQRERARLLREGRTEIAPGVFARTRAPRARGASREIHTHVNLNGREIARAVHRVDADDHARNRKRNR